MLENRLALSQSVYLEGTRSHNEGRVSTAVASPCQTLRELLAGVRPSSGIAHAHFVEGLHFSAFISAVKRAVNQH